MSDMSCFDIVQIARRVKRPSASQYISYIFDDFIEFHGDRTFNDDKAIIGGIAMLNKTPVTVIGTQKGQTTEDNIIRNFGSPHPEGYRKALRLMKQAEKFKRPIITFINTSGAYCGVDAEKRGQGEAIAKNLFYMSGLKTPIIAIIIGEGGSGGALALAVADSIWMLENSIYSVVSPEGFATILWKDKKRADEAADLMKLTAKDLLEINIIDKIIPEIAGGADLDYTFTADILKKELELELQLLTDKNTPDLLEKRFNKFRKIGEFNE